MLTVHPVVRALADIQNSAIVVGTLTFQFVIVLPSVKSGVIVPAEYEAVCRLAK
jgi:hypothetical protein